MFDQCKKVNKQKPQYIELGIVSGDYDVANREKKDSFWQRLSQKKSHGLFVSYSPPHFLFLSKKKHSFPFPWGNSHMATMV